MPRSMTCAIRINCFRAGHWPYMCSLWIPICRGPNQMFRVWVFVLLPISAMYWLGSWLVPSDKIRLYAIDILRTSTK